MTPESYLEFKKRDIGNTLEAPAAAGAVEQWAVVEVMGHQTFAGRISEQVFAGAPFCRVDVPATDATAFNAAQPAFTKLIGANSIYSLTPCSEQIARAAAASVRARPLNIVQLEYSFFDNFRLAASEDDGDDLQGN
jgi:hypothetical protein